MAPEDHRQDHAEEQHEDGCPDSDDELRRWGTMGMP